MNREQWLNTFSEAYDYSGIPFTDEIKQHLLSIEKENEAESYPGGIEAWKNSDRLRISLESQEIMRKYFWMKAIKGDTFGSLTRVKNRLGYTLESGYGLNNGPFINLAKTYWTYYIELSDLTQSMTGRSPIPLFYIGLIVFEDTTGSLFFPKEGPEHVSLRKRRNDQISVLKKYAPEIDIERFVNESPILKADSEFEKSSGAGCFTIIAVLSITLVLLIITFI